MARISFRQGIVSHPVNATTGEQSFLTTNGTNIDLNVNFGSSSDAVQVAFIHGTTDYLYTETRNVPSAWTGITAGTDFWLYWEINLDTGEVTRDSTIHEPIVSSVQPSGSVLVEGLMWFNTNTNLWHEYNGSRFREVVRVFAARVINGSTFESLSIAANNRFTGTQIGSLVGFSNSRRVGSLVYNSTAKAIKSGVANQFFTTEDIFLTGVPSGASLRINNIVVTGIAVCPIAAFQVVEYIDYNKICLANPATLGQRLFGIVDEDVATNEIATLISEGIIFNELWDWQALGLPANTPLYIDATGQLTPSNATSSRPPVATIIGRQEIFFAPRIFPQVTIDGGSGTGLTSEQETQLAAAVTTSAQNTALISALNTSVATLPTDVSNNSTAISEIQSDLDGKVAISGSTMTGTLVLSGNPVNNLDAATKEYVDALFRGFTLNFTIPTWVAVGDELHIVIPQTQHNLPLGTAFNVVAFNDANRRVSIGYTVDMTTGTITIITAGSAFAGMARIH